ncbi:MAG: nucleotidyltransferase domain-containing protein [Planctomycetota bacterium]
MIDPDRVEAALREYFRAAPDSVLCAWLFGSVGRGAPRDDSDVDVAVLYAESPDDSWSEQLRLESELERRLRMRVQVVIANRAPVDLLERALRDGRLLLDRNTVRRAEFELRVRREFFDLEPILRRYRTQRGSWDE